MNVKTAYRVLLNPDLIAQVETVLVKERIEKLLDTLPDVLALSTSQMKSIGLGNPCCNQKALAQSIRILA
jgi:hypothetical protein